MWSFLAESISLTKDDDTEGTSVDGENVKFREGREEKEFEGLVTGLFTDYGLIDEDIVFTKDLFFEKLPLIGDKLKVRACRGQANDTWRAVSVSKCMSVWDDSDQWNFNDIESVEEEKKRNLVARERRATERMFIEKLLKDKFGVEIGGEDFGQVEVSAKKSIELELKNRGSETQMLMNYYLIGSSQQVELGPLKVSAISLKEKSKKVQEAVPLIFEPGMTVILKVICQARFPGKESRTVVFEFTKFNIGRELTVDVTHSSVATYSKERTFSKSHAVDKIQRTRQDITNRDLIVVPGPKFQKSRERKFFKQKLPHYQVPENLKDCFLSGQDVTTVLPILKKPLNSSSYEARFKGLLHVEEIQQEVDIREFDINEAEMEDADEFLSLKIEGLSEGRPSVMLGDRAVASKSDCSLSVNICYEGVVHQVMKDSVLLKFSSEFHSTFESSVKYSVTFILNRITLRRCHRAVEIASKLQEKLLFPMKIVAKPPQTELSVSGNMFAQQCRNASRTVKFFNSSLNSHQQMAVIRILHGVARPLPYIIFGPPGTGKTVTVVETILQLQSNLPYAKILACAPSNSAADLLAERLYESGQVSRQSMVRLYAALRPGEAIPQSVRQYSAYVDDDDVDLEERSIVICTCSTAGNLYEKSGKKKAISFTHVLIDEAGQATEPECMIAVALAASSVEQVVLAGDPQQLGPVLRSNVAKDYGLQVSYLERLCSLPAYQRNVRLFDDGYDPLLVTKLVDNYRCHPALIALPSSIFYDDELNVKADVDVINCLSSWGELPNRSNFPILFHGVRGEDAKEGNSPSWFNPHEVMLVVKYLSSLLSSNKYELSPNDVGILTPYRKQAEKIRSMVDNFGIPKVKVGSVEEFQGQERLAIIISTVRSSESLIDFDLRHTLGFLDNRKRFNVAITRAQALLVVVGNPHVLCQDLYWSRLVEFCVDNEAYVGCDLPACSFDGHCFVKNRIGETTEDVEND